MNDYNKRELPVDRERLVDVLSKNNSRQHNTYLYYTEFVMIVHQARHSMTANWKT
jgi:ferritin-like protein